MSKFTIHSYVDLTDDQLALLPTDEEVASYHERGYHVSPVILPDEVLDEAVKGADAFYAGERDWEIERLERTSNTVIRKTKAIYNNELVGLRKKEFAKLVNYPMIAASAAKLARTNSIRFFADSLICKKPSTSTDPGVVGWHSDRAYWPTCTSHNMLTVWVPLQDVTIDMGPVFYIAESHKWHEDPQWKKFYNFNDQDLSRLDEFLAKEKPTVERVPMTLKRGQVSFHHGYTIHASRSNTSDRDRLAIGIHLQDQDNHYQPAFRDDGSLIKISYDHICRMDELGQPDYSDPAIFPKLFEAKVG